MPSEFEELACLAGLTRDELRAYLETEIERCRTVVRPGDESETTPGPHQQRI